MDNTDEIATGKVRLSLIITMAEFFRSRGYTDVRARTAHHPPPLILEGTQENHRPDVTCRQVDSSFTPIILDVVTSEALTTQLKKRLTLLESGARACAGELHFAALAHDGTAQRLRERLGALGIVANRVWEL